MGILRLLFALSVVTFHTEGTVIKFFDPFGAILSFFIISGFYMALILDKRYPAKLAFYISRAFRIYPMYWIALSITVGLGLVKTTFLGSDTNSILHYFQYSKHLTGINFYIESINFVMRNITLFIDKDYFGVQNKAAGYLILYQGWTLPIEILFYLSAPFVLRVKKDFLFFLAIFLIAFYGIITPFQLLPETSLAYLFMRYFIFFLMGALSYRYVYKRISDKFFLLNKKFFYIALAAFILFTIFFRAIVYDGFFLSFEISMLYHIPFAIFISFVFRLTKNNKLDNFLGEFSYPVYITHFIFIKLLDPIPRLSTSIPGALIIIMSTILLSFLLIKFVQAPIDKFRHRRFKS